MAVKYDAKTDYAKKMNDAKAKGDTKGYETAAAQREAKIKGEGLNDKGQKLNTPAATPATNSNRGSSGGNRTNSPAPILPTTNVATPNKPATVVTPITKPQYDTGIQSLIDSYNAAKSKVGSAATPAANTSNAPKTPNTPKTIEDYQNAWKSATTQAERDANHAAADKLRGYSTTTTKNANGTLIQTPAAVTTNVATPNKPVATPSVTPDWLNTGTNTVNPAGTVSGAVTTTKYVDPNGDARTGYIKGGRTYQDAACTTPVAVGSTVHTQGGTYVMTNDGGKSVDMTGVTKTTYKDPNNVPNVGYIKDGMTYTDAACTSRVPAGSKVTTADGKTYTMQATGGAVDEPAEVASETAAVQSLYDDLRVATNQIMASDSTLTHEQALAMAVSQLNPAYRDSINTAMSDIEKKALQTGFFGQLPTAALQMETAGKLETSKLQAINELAAQLFGESKDMANTKLSAATTAQQNKIANLLNLLGIVQSERSYSDDRSDTEWEKAYKKSQLAAKQ